MKLMPLIDEMEAELNRKGMFAKKVDLGKIDSLVQRLRFELPETIGEADYILANRKKILASADVAAQNTIREAEERANHIIENSELVKRAEDEADRIIDAAHGQAGRVVERTKTHLDEMFKDIEQFLLSVLAMIRNNREELRGARLLGKK